MQATTLNYSNTINKTVITINAAKREAIQKIVMFSAILTCIVAAVSL